MPFLSNHSALFIKSEPHHNISYPKICSIHIGKECGRKELYRISIFKKLTDCLGITEDKAKELFNVFSGPSELADRQGKNGMFFLRSSLTVEAAAALPLMTFALYLLMFPLKIAETERRVQNVMEEVAEELSLAEYIKTVGSEIIKSDSDYTETLGNVLTGVEQGTAAAAVLALSDLTLFKDVSFSADTAILSDAGGADSSMIYMELCYKPKLPVSVYSLEPAQKSIVTNKRAWIGSNGGRGRSKYGNELSEGEDFGAEDEDKTVYLGKTSSEVYHEDPNCHYLSNVLYSASVSEMESKRNISGGKYHACPSCDPGKSGTVYYSESGTAYHSSDSCKAITAYARSVKLSEVSGMRPCSYCGGSHGGT